MDDRRFDALARAFGAATSRRSALAMLAGTALLATDHGSRAEARRRRRRCDPPCPAGQACSHGACSCDNGGTACGASCCLTGQACQGGQCVPAPNPTCVPAGEPCKNAGRACCDDRTCASGQGGKVDVACYVPAGGVCRTTVDCVYDATCMAGACVANPRPTPAPACTPTFPVTADPTANGEALRNALANAASGDTILLAAGTYGLYAGEDGQGYGLRAATSATIAACPGARPTLRCDGAIDWDWACIDGNVAVTLQLVGLRIEGSGGGAVSREQSIGIRLFGGRGVELRDCEVTNFGSGVLTAPQAHQPVLTGGTTVTGNDRGIWSSNHTDPDTTCTGSGNTVTGNAVENCDRAYPDCGCASDG